MMYNQNRERQYLCGGNALKLLCDKIEKDGIILSEDILKVDSFLNHRLDIELLEKLGKEFYRIFKDKNIDKIVTIEASGIALACMAAVEFKVPVVFAKKSRTSNLGRADVYTSQVASFTHQRVYDVMISKQYLSEGERILVIDDFLARGNALVGLFDIIEQSGATVAGAGVAIEKGYQGGGDSLREKGYDIVSLARIESMSVDGGVVFAKESLE